MVDCCCYVHCSVLLFCGELFTFASWTDRVILVHYGLCIDTTHAFSLFSTGHLPTYNMNSQLRLSDFGFQGWSTLSGLPWVLLYLLDLLFRNKHSRLLVYVLVWGLHPQFWLFQILVWCQFLGVFSALNILFIDGVYENSIRCFWNYFTSLFW